MGAGQKLPESVLSVFLSVHAHPTRDITCLCCTHCMLTAWRGAWCILGALNS